jgi:hypothetical protein
MANTAVDGQIFECHSVCGMHTAKSHSFLCCVLKFARFRSSVPCVKCIH